MPRGVSIADSSTLGDYTRSYPLYFRVAGPLATEQLVTDVALVTAHP